MLGKLLKYEIPALGRRLVPLYIGWIATAALLGLMVGPLQKESEFMIVISALLYTAAATAVVVMAVVMIIQRYNNSLLGDEAYFNQVLPVTASQHIASKTISAMLWVLLSMVAMAVTGIIIAMFSGHFLDIFKVNWLEFLSKVDWLTVILVLLVTVFGITKSVLQIYAAITIGRQAKQHTTLAAIGAYIGLMIAETFVGRGVTEAMSFKFYDVFNSIAGFRMTMLIALVVTIAIGVIYFFICNYLMEKKLNLN